MKGYISLFEAVVEILPHHQAVGSHLKVGLQLRNMKHGVLQRGFPILHATDDLVCDVQQLDLGLNDALLLEFVYDCEVLVVSEFCVIKVLLVLLDRLGEMTSLLLEELQCFFDYFQLRLEVQGYKDLAHSFVESPLQTPQECQQLSAKLGSPHLYLFHSRQTVLPQDLGEYRIVLSVVFNGQMKVDMVVLVVLKGHPVPHQHHSVRQSSVAEEELGVFFKLIFGTTEHEELVKLVLFPHLGIVINAWGRHYVLLPLPTLLLVEDGTVIGFREFTLDLHGFQLGHIIRGGPLHSSELHFLVIDRLVAFPEPVHSLVHLQQEPQAHIVSEVNEVEQIVIDVLCQFGYFWTVISVLSHDVVLDLLVVIFRILILLTVIRPVARVKIIDLLLCQYFLFIELLLGIVGVPWLVVHSVVHIGALVVDQLGKGHHRCVLKVFAETAGNKVDVYPPYVLLRENVF